MAYFALLYDLVDNMATRRAPFREEHLRLARESHARGELVLAGAFADPPDRALLVFKVPDRHVAEEFARLDPYVVNDLVTRWQVRPWTVAVGQVESAAGRAS